VTEWTSNWAAATRVAMSAALLALLSASAVGQVRWHVDASATPGGDGSTWANALDSVNVALSNSTMGDEIWVKAGTYTAGDPTDVNDPRSATFSVPVGVPLRGGFDGTEVSLDQRAGLFSQTILTGDLGQLGVINDNAYHVVTAHFGSGVPPAPTTVDGFTIRDGNANSAGNTQGGGVWMFNAGLWISNCIIRDNYATHGAGLHGQPAAVRMRWCEFIDNHARERGGALWGQAINYKISHTIFRGNTADKGGAIFLTSIGATSGELPIVLVHNSLFYDNAARRGGAILLGGFWGASGKATFSSCTIAYNTAREGGGGSWANTGSQIPAESYFYNSIVWHNTAPVNPNLHGRHGGIACNFQDGTFYGAGNIMVDPLFVDGPNRDLRLLTGSPSVDTGSNAMVPRDFVDVNGDGNFHDPQTLDLDRQRRIVNHPSAPSTGRVIDMGAFEL